MKHTMKKLLCMALAIMLLVSAVPVFAAATNDIYVDVVYAVDGNGKPTQWVRCYPGPDGLISQDDVNDGVVPAITG